MPLHLYREIMYNIGVLYVDNVFIVLIAHLLQAFFFSSAHHIDFDIAYRNEIMEKIIKYFFSIRGHQNVQGIWKLCRL